jgi:hypothetical protein
MLNQTIQIKFRQRLNKIASNDYDNIECWQMVEAFNKAQVEWCRRNLHGNNMFQEGDENSTRRIDDLQVLLTTLPLTTTDNGNHVASTNFPDVTEYLEYKRVSLEATSECCPEPRSMTCYLTEEANIDLLLRNPLKNPNFEWGETVCTIANNVLRIYKEDFTIVNPTLIYYRQPTLIQIQDCIDPYTGLTSTVDILCEFKDDLVELFIDEAAAIIAGDIADANNYSREMQSAERNN